MRPVSFAIALTLAVLTFGSIAPARADDREEARREFKAGEAADRDKDFANAVSHYLRAFDILPHPFTAFNIASDYERLDELKKAATWYRKVLDLDPTSADAPKTRAHLVELSAHAGPVRIVSTPTGARVLVDGNPEGSTPVTVTVAGGSHRVTLEQDGQHQDRQITTEYGELQTVSFSLAGADGFLVVFGSPVGASVFIDGQQVGSLPSQSPVATGDHALVVQSPGYADVTQTVHVNPSTTTRIPIQLTREGDAIGGVNPSSLATLSYGYLLGLSGGVDVAHAGSDFTFDLGYHISKVELVAQIGSQDGLGYLDVLVRYTLGNRKIAPFVGAGYVFSSSADTRTASDGSGDATAPFDGGNGFEAVAGLRYELARNATTSVVARATIGAAFVSGSDGGSTAVVVPVTVGFEVTIGRNVDVAPRPVPSP